MDAFDTRLRDRLETMESSLRVEVRSQARRRAERRWTAPAVAAIALLALGTGNAGATFLGDAVRGHPGLFSRGGPLHCTRIQEMAPPRAADLLGLLGYSVTWQIEDRDAGTSVQLPSPPADGYIIEGILKGRYLTLVVERGANAIPAEPDPTCAGGD